MEDLSSAFSLEAARFMVGTFRNSGQPKSRRCNFENKVLALSLFKCNPKSYILLRTLLPLPSRRFLLNTVPFRTGTNAHTFHDALQHSLQKMYGRGQ
jgi:hypothetical protein